MARSLLCRTCGLHAAKSEVDFTRTTPASVDGPEETERFVWGPTLRSGYVCDSCLAPIGAGEKACCVSAMPAGRELGSWERGLISVSPRPVAAS